MLPGFRSVSLATIALANLVLTDASPLAPDTTFKIAFIRVLGLRFEVSVKLLLVDFSSFLKGTADPHLLTGTYPNTTNTIHTKQLSS